MRLLLIGSVVVALGLALSPASAQNGRGHSIYSGCKCNYGYGEACVPATSCESQGGKCGGSCAAPPD
jgi:hypothetical protein